MVVVVVVGVSGAVRGTSGLPLVGVIYLLLHTDLKHQTFWVACSERVLCAYTVRMYSSSLSFTIESWVFACIVFLAGIISWSMDSTLYYCKRQFRAKLSELTVLNIHCYKEGYIFQWLSWLLCCFWVVFNMRILIILRHAKYSLWWGFEVLMTRLWILLSSEM